MVMALGRFRSETRSLDKPPAVDTKTVLSYSNLWPGGSV